MGDIVIRLVILLVQTEAADGLCHYTPPRQRDVVRAHEEILTRVRISDQGCALLGEFRSKVGAFPTGQPQSIRCYCRVRAPDHLEFKVRHHAGERYRRMIEEVARAEASHFFTAEADEIYRAFRFTACTDGAGQLEHCSHAASIIVSTVVDIVARHTFFFAEMVEMRSQ